MVVEKMIWIGLLCAPLWLQAQESDFQAFIQASIRRDYNEAFDLLYQQEQEVLLSEGWLDNTQMFQPEQYLASRVTLGSVARQGLLKGQAILARQSDSLRIYWYHQSAESVLLYQSTLRDSLVPVLSRAVTALGPDTPPVFWRELSAAMLADIPTDKSEWALWLDAFRALGYLLIQMPVVDPANQELADRQFESLRALIHAYGIDCMELRKAEASRVRMGFVTPAENARLFMLAEFKECAYTAVEDTIRHRIQSLSPSPFLLVLAADSYLQDENFWEAQRHMLKAIEEESDPRYKALLELRLAGIYAIRRSFRSARLHAKQADEWYPEWGRPWLFLADLVESSAGTCADSQRQRWGITWLAMEYCETAARKNPDLKAEVAARLRLLREDLPGPERMAFHGLNLGDRIPVTCWINEAARVH